MKTVSQTLFFTLCARANDPRFHDPMAEEIVRTHPEISQHSPDWITQKIITHRASFFDGQIRRIKKNNPTTNLALINLGGGLCSRFQRVKKDISNSIHLDFPEVIEALKDLFPVTASHLISADLNDQDWIGQVKNALNESETPVFCLEGVSMYLDKTPLLNLFNMLPTNFSRGFIVCDLLHPFFQHRAYIVRSVAQVGASFHSGVTSTKEIIDAAPLLKLDHARPPFVPTGLPQIPPFNLYQFAIFSWGL